MTEDPIPYNPPPLPVPTPFDAELHRHLSLADRMLGEFKGRMENLPNPGILFALMTRRGAVMSAQIEGSQATVSDVLLFEADDTSSSDPEKRDDRLEIVNDRRALSGAEQKLHDGYRFDLWLLRGMHGILLSDSVRGSKKTPGAFRNNQVWLGPPGVERNKSLATYTPPSVEKVPELMENWLAHWRDDNTPPLVQAAILHGQFEMIHPFKDGNGRVGRLLIPLFLQSVGVLQRPVFNLSGCLLARREEYYAGLRGLSERSDWRGWLEFFLNVCVEQAQENNRITSGILDLHKRLTKMEFFKSRHAALLLDAMFARPVFTLRSLEFAGKRPSDATLNNLMQSLTKAGFVELKYSGVRGRPSVYALPALVKILEDRS